MVTHKGGCHCGAIAYEFQGEVTGAMECNCSLCAKRGGLLHFIPEKDFTLKTSPENVSTYMFNKHAIEHHFCAKCGIDPYSEGDSPQGKMVMINLRCVDGVDPHALDIKFHNGIKD